MNKFWRACLLALMLCLLLCGSALAGDRIYTMTLEPGEGSGSAFTVQSTTVISEAEFRAGHYDQTKGCFYLDDNGKVYYSVPRQSPFTAPTGKELDLWESSYYGASFAPGSDIDTAFFGDCTLMAKWREPKPKDTATLSIPATINVEYGAAQTAFDIQVETLSFNNIIEGFTTFAFSITLWDSVFTNTDNETIPFTVSNNGLNADRRDSAGWSNITIWWDSQPEYPYTYQGFIHITSDAWAAAKPGSYTASLRYEASTAENFIESGSIALTLVVPDPTVYAATVNSGTGGGEYAQGASVTITANTPETGKRFKAWTGADDLVFTEGSATTATATFTMPAEAVTLTATYEDILYPITCANQSAVAMHEVGWLDWQPTGKAAMGEALSLRLADGAKPAGGCYFTGEFAVNGTSLGVEYNENDVNHLFPWPVTEMTMPAGAISIAAVEAEQQEVTLDFSQGATLTMPSMALVQLRNGKDTAALFTCDENLNEFIDLNGSGRPDIAVTEPDYETTADFTLTLLPGNDASDPCSFEFTGPTDRYSPVAVSLPAITFGTPDFTLPAGIQAIEANAFEGIAASIVDVPVGCAFIDDCAFKDCRSLTRIRIPAGCQLGNDVFDGCALVYIFGAAGSSAETYCQSHENCRFIENAQD